MKSRNRSPQKPNPAKPNTSSDADARPDSEAPAPNEAGAGGFDEAALEATAVTPAEAEDAGVALDELPAADPAMTDDEAVEVVAEPVAEPVYERPISERRRRRLVEEQRQAEERAARARDEAARLDVPPLADAAAKGQPVDMAVAAGQPPAPVDTPAPPPPAIKTTSISQQPMPTGRHAYMMAGLASALWVAGVASWAAYETGAGGAEFDPLRMAIYALIALAPVGLAIMLAHTVRQGAGLAAETKRARDLAQALVAPTALAAQQTGEVLHSLRADIDHSALAAERARQQMVLLREALTQETHRLNEAAENANRTARRLTESLGTEREEMTRLGTHLDAQSASVVEAVERQSRMVADASDLAQVQLREAEAALAARAADLAAAAGEAQDAARSAADDLARQTIRLENAGSGVAEQIQSVEEGLTQQRASLVTAAYQLRTDQEDFSAQVESQRAQLHEHLSSAKATAEQLDETSRASGETLKDLIEAAGDQFRALIDMSQKEADNFDAATKVSLDRFEALAAEARDALMEETRRALEQMRATAEDSRAAAADASEQARLRADRLSESLFEAAQKADQAADARVEEARRLVSESATLVEQTGDRTIQRMEAVLDRLNSALSEIDTAVADVDQRASRLPEEARARTEQIRATVEQGLAALAAASRKAAEDTEALDAGFQERVRRNYDMLTEAVRLMGVVSGDAPVSRRRGGDVDAERQSLRAAEDAQDDRGANLRGRLKLAPADPARPASGDRLDWNDLVAGDAEAERPLELDTPVASPNATEGLSDRLTAAIRRMGVDPNALLPRSRVEEAARAFFSGDADGARHIVRRVAPAAVRSVSRRILSDPDLRNDAERYVRAFNQELTAAARSGDGTAVQSRLASDPGRAYMLLDAAVGDLA